MSTDRGSGGSSSKTCKQEWISHPARRVLRKAMAGNLRSLRFKGMMRSQDRPRTALVDALGQFGDSIQINQNAEQMAHRNDYQGRIFEIVAQFMPDLLILQAQRDGPQAIHIGTIQRIKAEFPWMLILSLSPFEETSATCPKAMYLPT